LSSDCRDQLCGPLDILVWSWVYSVLVYWGLVSLPHALSLGQGQRSISLLFAISMLCWFAEYFSILQHHLTLDVTHWLRRLVLWTTICPISGSGLSHAHCWPFYLSSLCLLKVHTEISSFPLSPSLMHLQQTTPSAACPFQFFIIQFLCVCVWGGGQSTQKAMLVYPSGSCGNTSCRLFAHLLVCWMFPKQVWSQTSCFLGVTCHGEALYRL
jgi:hypothetical protein